jgi:hypothetical protein
MPSINGFKSWKPYARTVTRDEAIMQAAIDEQRRQGKLMMRRKLGL